MPASTAKRVVRSALISVPWLYDAQMAWRWRRALRRGQPHEPDFAALTHLGLAAELVLDVGANLGQSIGSIKLCEPAARIVSFEPNPLLWPALDKVAAGYAEVRVERVGLGEREEVCPLWVPRVRGYEFRQLASTAPPEPAETAAFLSAEVFLRPVRPDEVRLGQMECHIRALDSFGLRPALIKIDTEGTAPDVLAGASETLAACRPMLLIESDPRQAEELRDMLAPWGYRLAAWTEGRFRLDQPGELNNWFLPPDRLEQALTIGT